MRSTAFVLTLTLALALLHNALAEKCTPMDPEKKEMYEGVFNYELMGCQLTPREALTALSRMYWAVPAGEHVIEIADDSDAAKKVEDMGTKQQSNMAKFGMKLIGKSLEKDGTLSVSPECLTSVEPDYVAYALGTAKDSKTFNEMMGTECSKKTVRRVVSARVPTEEIALLINLLTGIIGITFTLLFPFIGGETVELLQQLVDSIVQAAPCPSVVARMVNTVY